MTTSKPSPKPAARPATKKSTKPDGGETLKMALAMLKMFKRTSTISISEIAELLAAQGFVRDVNSIRRQLKALCAVLPIEKCDTSIPHGYKWASGGNGISIPGLTTQEALMFSLAQKHLSMLMPPSLVSAMTSFFEQSKANLGHIAQGKPERKWMEKVRVVSDSIALLPPDIKPGVFETVTEALYNEKFLELEYVNAENERWKKRVMPLGLVQQGSRMYLVVRFEGRTNQLSLALNRIQKASISSESIPPIDFDLSKYEDDGRFVFGDGKRIKLKFRIKKKRAAFLTESKLSKDQQVEDLGDWLEITATVVESDQLVWWLRGFGERVEVLMPESLAGRVAEI